MADPFNDLPEYVHFRLSENPSHKEWKQCEVCHVYHTAARLKMCSGCAETGGGGVYYCSKKCQREHWPYHKEDCLSVLPRTDEAMRQLSRWLSVHRKVLIWCLEQLYHYNKAADPCKSFVCFHLDGEKMNLQRMCLQQRAGHTLFPPKRLSTDDQDKHYYLVELEPCKSHKGTYKLSNFSSSTLTQPNARRKIVGHPQWPWIAAHVTNKWQTSAFVTSKKLMFLRTVIGIHIANGTLLPGRKFVAQPVVSSTEITSAQMQAWYEVLNSVDFWKPMRDSRHLVTSLFDECCPLTHEPSTH